MADAGNGLQLISVGRAWIERPAPVLLWRIRYVAEATGFVSSAISCNAARAMVDEASPLGAAEYFNLPTVPASCQEREHCPLAEYKD